VGKTTVSSRRERERESRVGESEIGTANWKDGVQSLVEELWQKALEVLEGEWLKGEIVEGSLVEDDGTGSSDSHDCCPLDV